MQPGSGTRCRGLLRLGREPSSGSSMRSRTGFPPLVPTHTGGSLPQELRVLWGGGCTGTSVERLGAATPNHACAPGTPQRPTSALHLAQWPP